MAKHNYSKVLIDFEGKPHLDEKNKELTLGAALIKACSIPAQGDDKLGPMGKFEIGRAGSCVARGLSLADDQVTMLKERVEKIFMFPSLVYVVCDLLDNPQATFNADPIIEGSAPVAPLAVDGATTD